MCQVYGIFVFIVKPLSAVRSASVTREGGIIPIDVTTFLVVRKSVKTGLPIKVVLWNRPIIYPMHFPCIGEKGIVSWDHSPVHPWVFG